MRRLTAPLLLLAALAATGCASTNCVAPTGDANVTPAAVSTAGGHTGELVRWGGTITSARNLEDSTELEVIAYPLDRCGQPRTNAEPIGRFVVVQKGYLETAEYQPGRAVTVSGLISGVRAGSVGDAPYRFALLQSRDLMLVPEQQAFGGYTRPFMSIGIGGGSGGVGGGIGVSF